MDEYNNSLENTEAAQGAEGAPPSPDQMTELVEQMRQIQGDVSYLRDLFVRRLNDDKQKNAVIQKLAEGATHAYIEPFLHDIILLLDRLEKSDDDFVASVNEELYGILNRRGVERIPVESDFNPALHKAVKICIDPDAETMRIVRVIRNGYKFSGKVIRPAEVEVAKPDLNRNSDQEEPAGD